MYGDRGWGEAFRKRKNQYVIACSRGEGDSSLGGALAVAGVLDGRARAQGSAGVVRRAWRRAQLAPEVGSRDSRQPPGERGTARGAAVWRCSSAVVCVRARVCMAAS